MFASITVFDAAKNLTPSHDMLSGDPVCRFASGVKGTLGHFFNRRRTVSIQIQVRCRDQSAHFRMAQKMRSKPCRARVEAMRDTLYDCALMCVRIFSPTIQDRLESGLECSDVSINMLRSRCLHIRSSVLSINACISVCAAPLFSFNRQIEKSRQRNVGLSGVVAFSELENRLAGTASFIRVVHPGEPYFVRAAIWRSLGGGASTIIPFP